MRKWKNKSIWEKAAPGLTHWKHQAAMAVFADKYPTEGRVDKSRREFSVKGSSKYIQRGIFINFSQPFPGNTENHGCGTWGHLAMQREQWDSGIRELFQTKQFPDSGSFANPPSPFPWEEVLFPRDLAPDLLIDLDGFLVLLQLCRVSRHLQQTLVG